MKVSLRIIPIMSMLQQKTSFSSELLRKRQREGTEEETQDDEGRQERRTKIENKTENINQIVFQYLIARVVDLSNSVLKYRPRAPLYCIPKTIFYSISQDNGLEDKLP